MVNFYDPTLADKEWIDPLVAGSIQSEACFTTFFAWRKEFQFKIAKINSLLCVELVCLHGNRCMMVPFGNAPIAPAIEAIRHFQKSEKLDFFFNLVSTEAKQKLELEFPTLFHFETRRDSYDYVYNASDLHLLKGNRYHSKKRHLNRFFENNKAEYEPITGEMAKTECFDALKMWSEHCDNWGKHELEAYYNMMMNFNYLGLRGGLLRLNGRIIAMSVGEKLTEEMALLHLEKTEPESREAFVAINQQFVEHAWQDVKYINREEDLGISGLRKAKMSYHPAFFVEKYIAVGKE